MPCTPMKWQGSGCMLAQHPSTVTLEDRWENGDQEPENIDHGQK